MKAKTSLIIIVGEYFFAFVITLIWSHFRNDQGWIPGLIYAAYLLTPTVALCASCIQFVILTDALVKKWPLTQPVYFRAVAYPTSFLVGIVLSMTYQHQLGSLFV